MAAWNGQNGNSGFHAGLDRTSQRGKLFLQHAESILQTAQASYESQPANKNAVADGSQLCAEEWTILYSQSGGWHMVADSDWPLDGLQRHHGAEFAYRVSKSKDSVQLQASSEHGELQWKAPTASHQWNTLLPERRDYRLIA